MRIAGVEIPDNKRVAVALTYIYGVGRGRAREVLEKAQIDNKRRVKDLGEKEIVKIHRTLDSYKIEGDLRREISDNIQRLKVMGTYRGWRHKLNLPVRGQRTKSNARVKRGKRKTVGAISKKQAQKMGVDLGKKKEERKES